MDKRRSGFGMLIILICVALLVSAVLLLKSQESKSVVVHIDTPVPSSNTDLNVENLIKSSVCQTLSKDWEIYSIADTVSFKVPSYITQDKSYYGQSLVIHHPTFGILSLQTSLIGDYVPQDVIGFENILQNLIESRKEHFVESSHYTDENKNHFIVGKDYVIVAKEGQMPRWWMFNILQADGVGSQTSVPQFMQTDDFKCLLRSVEFK